MADDSSERGAAPVKQLGHASGTESVVSETEPVAVSADGSLPPLLNSWTRPFVAVNNVVVRHLPSHIQLGLGRVDGFVHSHTGLPQACALAAVLLTVWVSIKAATVVVSLVLGKGTGKRRSKTVLLLGPCGSGKTAMANQLCQGLAVDSVMSMKIFEYNYPLRGDKTLIVVDHPGHQRLRSTVPQELARAAGVVFVLDGADVTGQIRGAAELLYDVLTDSSMERSRGVLVACNKGDIKAVKPSRVRVMLQKELERLRETRGTMSVQGDDDGDGRAIPLGRQGQPLDLDVDAPCEINFCACSAKTDDLGEVRDFVARCT